MLRKRLWCRHLKCGRIIAELADGTLLLCVRRFGHPARNCFNPAFAPPQAFCQTFFWRTGRAA